MFLLNQSNFNLNSQTALFKIFKYCFNFKNKPKIEATVYYQPSIHIHANFQNIKTVPLVYRIFDAGYPDVAKESPVFILHGIYGSKSDWSAVAEHVADKTRRIVITVDQRNHGESPHSDDMTYYHLAADLVQLMSKLQVPLGEPSFIGHSIGGRAIMTLALHEPTLIKDVIIVDIKPTSQLKNIYFHNVFVKFLNEIELPVNVSIAEGKQIVNTKLKQMVKRLHLRALILSNLIKKSGYKNFSWQFNVEALSKNMQNLTSLPKFDDTVNAQFAKPILFILGKQSTYGKEEDYIEIHKIFPSSKIIYIEDSGNVVHSHQPAKFLKSVTAFLEDNSILY